tara:strand:- start:2543 stop:2713 length:171 start_codon:yes stop_codon:yes gene_type:complete
MPTKTTQLNEDVKAVRQRMSDLVDRMTVLENNLKRTQDLVQQDMKRLITMVEQRTK